MHLSSQQDDRTEVTLHSVTRKWAPVGKNLQGSTWSHCWDTCSSLETWTELRISPFPGLLNIITPFLEQGFSLMDTYVYSRNEKARWFALKTNLGLHKQCIHAKTSYWIYFFILFSNSSNLAAYIDFERLGKAKWAGCRGSQEELLSQRKD